MSFVNYSEKIQQIQTLAGDLQSELNTKYTPTSILYFNPKDEGDVTISNYAQSSNVKVLVGPEQLDEFFNKFVFHGRIQYNVDDLQTIMDKIESFMKHTNVRNRFSYVCIFVRKGYKDIEKP